MTTVTIKVETSEETSLSQNNNDKATNAKQVRSSKITSCFKLIELTLTRSNNRYISTII